MGLENLLRKILPSAYSHFFRRRLLSLSLRGCERLWYRKSANVFEQIYVHLPYIALLIAAVHNRCTTDFTTRLKSICHAFETTRGESWPDMSLSM